MSNTTPPDEGRAKGVLYQGGMSGQKISYQAWQCQECGAGGAGNWPELKKHFETCEKYQEKVSMAKEESKEVKDKLLPCPFCGGIDIILFNESQSRREANPGGQHTNGPDSWLVGCPGCEAQISGRSPHRLRTNWNRRSKKVETASVDREMLKRLLTHAAYYTYRLTTPDAIIDDFLKAEQERAKTDALSIYRTPRPISKQKR